MRAHFTLLSLLVIGSSLLAACGPGSLDKSAENLTIQDCEVQSLKARCGTLTVWENREAESGKQIGIHFVVILAQQRRAEPDPLFFIAGGPGVAGTNVASSVLTQFGDIHRRRDIVYFDQRGAGESNALLCPDPEGQDFNAYAKSCLESLSGDPRYYVTTLAMDDMDDLRRALGYELINLYGGSYGATAAQVYMNRHPEAVRSVILDHGTLLQVSFTDVWARNSQRSLDLVFDRCLSDPACQAAYPNLRVEFATLLDMLKEPVETNTFDPDTAKPVTMDRLMFNAYIHHLLMNGEVFDLPGIIHTAVGGNWDEIAQGYLKANRVRLWSGFSVMQNEIECYEDWWIGDKEAMIRQSQGSYYFENVQEMVNAQEQLCSYLPNPGPSAHHGPALPSGTPVLFLTGEIDPQNPIENLAGYQEIWPNSLAIIQPFTSHSTNDRSCWPGIMAAFVEQASVENLPLECASQTEIPPFKIRP